MSNIYFPGANTGLGFFSRFSGIAKKDEPCYTYVLKGGPGVGKNTLMRTVAKRATDKGMTVEEFRCASDPGSFDAVRIPEIKTIILDGTSPHSIDPYMPGICDEVTDLGHFKNKNEFAKIKSELDSLFAKNKACYRKAYALLGAARILKKEALYAAYEAIDKDKLRALLLSFMKATKEGSARELFAASATPDGIVDFSNSFTDKNTVFLSGILGEAALCEAIKMLAEKDVTVGYGFIDPEIPAAIKSDSFSLAIGEGETLIGICASPLSKHIPAFIEESECLCGMAIKELAAARDAHDEIERLYRPFVDYEKVNEESKRLLRELNI